jgi:hypothetical protein
MPPLRKRTRNVFTRSRCHEQHLIPWIHVGCAVRSAVCFAGGVHIGNFAVGAVADAHSEAVLRCCLEDTVRRRKPGTRHNCPSTRAHSAPALLVHQNSPRRQPRGFSGELGDRGQSKARVSIAGMWPSREHVHRWGILVGDQGRCNASICALHLLPLDRGGLRSRHIYPQPLGPPAGGFEFVAQSAGGPA